VHVSITPPFWETWTFRIVSGVAALAALFLFYRRRIRGLEQERRTQEAYSLRLIESQENERKRIASELHDSLGQDLLVIRNRALLGLKDSALSEHARDQLDQISAVAAQAISGVREIAHDLRPYQLDRLGLTKAVTSLVSAAAEAASVRFHVAIDAIDDEISKGQDIHIYRIVQEGVNNILKHARATEASLTIHKEARDIKILISDNGQGIAPGMDMESGIGRGLGLTGITERARVLGGTATLTAIPGAGTTLTVVVPRKGGE
jgi:signal transduction histidine kinase